MTLLRLVIGVVLRRARQEQGKTLRDVADEARVSVQYLSEVERGRKEASSEVLAAVCAALGWTILDLLDEVRADLAATPAHPLHVPAAVPGREPVEVPALPARGSVRASVEAPAPLPLRSVVPVGLTPVPGGRVRVAA